MLQRRALLIALVSVALVLVVVWSAEQRSSRGTRVRQVDTSSFPVGVSFGDRLRTASPAQLARALDDVVRLHAGWIRVDLSWAALQPTASRPVNFSETDRLVRAARRRGIEVLGIVGYTPAWARSPGCTAGPSCPPASDTAFARFAASVVRHYRHREVAALEVWNEPNLPIFWSGPDPVAYRNLLIDTVRSVREVSSRVTILSGGLALTGPTNGAIPPETFLAQACGAGTCPVDAVSYHPYTLPYLASSRTEAPTGWERMTRSSPSRPSLREVMRSCGLGADKIWVTEYGAPTSGAGAGATRPSGTPGAAVDHVSESLQARIVASGITEAFRQRLTMGAVFIYTWQDLDYYHDREDHFGLRRVDGSRKPSWSAFRRAAAAIRSR